MALEQISDTNFRDVLPSGETVELGDFSSTKFRPHILLNRWRGEAGVSWEFPLTGNLKPQIVGSALELISGNYKLRWYRELSAGDLGGYEFELILGAKPPINYFDLDFLSKNTIAYYQPVLSPGEKGYASRQGKVGGSYALYHSSGQPAHKSKADADYHGIWKVGHIFRPLATDALGRTIWGVLSIISGKLRVWFDPLWLASAAYPVVIDPTFGYTSVGATEDWWDVNELHGIIATSPSDVDTADSISIYTEEAATRNVKGVLVLASTLAIITNGVGGAAAVVPDPGGWSVSAFATPPSLVASTDYLISAVLDNTIKLHWDTETNVGRRDSSNSYASPTNPTDAATNSNKYSMYITYTATAAGQPYIIRGQFVQGMRTYGGF